MGHLGRFTKTLYLVLFVLLVTLGLSQDAFADPLTLFPNFVDSFSVAAQDGIPTGVAFSSDGTKMFVVGATGDDINEYTLTTAFDVSTASFVDSFSVATEDTSPTGVAFSSDGTKMFVVGFAGDAVYEYTLTTAFDVSTASFVDSKSVAAEDTAPQDVAFSTDGTKMFVLGIAGADVNEYTLTTAFDVSTAAFVDSFSVASEDTLPPGLAFSSDGTKMFVVGNDGDDINEYTLTTAFDISTASFVDSFSIATEETGPTGIAFSSDGTKMFVVGAAGDAVYEYIHTTVSFVDSFLVATGDIFPHDVAFSSDGSKMFVVGLDGVDINEYTLTTAFDVSTASFVDSFSVVAQELAPSGFAFDSLGTKMFVVGTFGEAVYEYNITTFRGCFGLSSTILGTIGNDVLSGTAGVDVILGFDGDDIINGLSGNDVICAGDGNDTVDGGGGNDTIFGEAGNDVIRGRGGDDTINGGIGNDTVLGGGGDDTINGGAGVDELRGQNGEDTINGGDDADAIFGGRDRDTINGGLGNDTIFGNNLKDTISGGDGNDVIVGGTGTDVFDGDAGDDIILGSSGTDIINGGTGDDKIFGQQDVDIIDGGPDTDQCFDSTDTLSNCEL